MGCVFGGGGSCGSSRMAVRFWLGSCGVANRVWGLPFRWAERKTMQMNRKNTHPGDPSTFSEGVWGGFGGSKCLLRKVLGSLGTIQKHPPTLLVSSAPSSAHGSRARPRSSLEGPRRQGCTVLRTRSHLAAVCVGLTCCSTAEEPENTPVTSEKGGLE